MLDTDIVYAFRKLFVPFGYFCLHSVMPLSLTGIVHLHADHEAYER